MAGEIVFSQNLTLPKKLKLISGPGIFVPILSCGASISVIGVNANDRLLSSIIYTVQSRLKALQITAIKLRNDTTIKRGFNIGYSGRNITESTN